MNLQNALLEGLQALQKGLLAVLHALGLASDVDGQPAWPFAHRLATETFVIDAALTRQVAAVLIVLAAALLLLVAGAASRRARWRYWTLAMLALVLAPWPSPAIVFTDAVATSFHRSTTGFTASSIEHGLVLYAQRCASCHGSDGQGEGPRAASLPMWPPRLSGELLWRRAEGELFWEIRHGIRDRHGIETMPGGDAHWNDADVWALVDGLRALAAGTGARLDGAWSPPVRAPDAALRCARDADIRTLAALRGQRLRIVAGGAALSGHLEDPRLVTILVGAAPDSGAAAASGSGAAAAADCVVADTAAYAAYAQIAGVDPAAFDGAQMLVDRDGWLRAYGPPGQTAWSDRDFLCRSEGTAPRAAAGSSADDLGALIASIDADPVRSSGLGLAHAR